MHPIRTSDSIPETVAATQDGADMRFNSRELPLDWQDFSKLPLEPAMATMVAGIESDVLIGCMKSTYPYAGTAGTTISSLTAMGAARTRLNQNLAPKSDRSIQLDSGTMGGLVTGVAGYFNPS